MVVDTKLTLRQELDTIIYDLRGWDDLFPYEKDHIINRLKEIALEVNPIVGPYLTKNLLDAICRLDIAR